MLTNNAAYKYETPYNRPFVITKRCANMTVTVQYGVTKSKHNICHINSYTSDTTVEDINIEKYA